MEADIQKAIDSRLFEAMVIFPYIDFFPDLQRYYILDKSRYILVDENWSEKADVYVLPYDVFCSIRDFIKNDTIHNIPIRFRKCRNERLWLCKRSPRNDSIG